MQRPTSVTVFGILNIVFGVIGGLGTAASLFLFALPASSNNPMVQIIHENATYAVWLKVSVALGLLSCAMLLAAGIGLLRMKNWARLLSIGYAIYAIGFGVLGGIVNFLFVFRPLLERAREQHGPEAAGAIGGAIGGSVGGCFGMIYPILLLIFMLRPNLKAAFTAPQS